MMNMLRSSWLSGRELIALALHISRQAVKEDRVPLMTCDSNLMFFTTHSYFLAKTKKHIEMTPRLSQGSIKNV